MCPVTRATQATRAVLAPHPAQGAEHVATHVQPRRQGALSGIGPTRTLGRHPDRGLPVQDADLPLLLSRVREHLSAGEDTHPPSLALALVLHLRDVARLVKNLVRPHILARARLLPEELRENEATPAQVHLLLAELRHETEAILAHQHHLVDAARVILDRRSALSLVRALHHLEEQAQDVDALHPDLPLALLRDEQDLQSETNVAYVVTHRRQKHPDLDRPLAVLDELAMLLLAGLNPRL